MPNIDLPLRELLAYKPELTREPDFDAFWDKHLARSAAVPLNVRLTPQGFPARLADVYEVVYDGVDGTPVHGWFVVPKRDVAPRPLPVVVCYHGYSATREPVAALLKWTALGVAAMSVDVRGQAGPTPDLVRYPQGSAVGWMTLGILDPNTYYYLNVYLDCVRAIDAVCSLPDVDPARIAVCGASQGGGLTLAAAALHPRPKLAMPVYPFLCHFRRAVECHLDGPYDEIRKWFRRFDPQHRLEEQVYRTLSYFDGMNMAARVRARTLMAIALQDTVCPPSTCFAAYHHLAGEKELRLYPDHGHEPLPSHDEEMMRFVEAYL